ncbi:MAG TPA: DUF4406 domain-containing protein [Myxococcota bacterium]|jgi:hypothetical protein|nr:DUF4406 domain-containing protein [Myxococcota bacterium]
MILVYVAGAYASPEVITVLNNMGKGISAAAQLLQAGFAPFCPWLDGLFIIQQGGTNTLTADDMKRYSMAWLERSDCVLVLSGWENSEGTKAEIARAQELEIPVYYNMADLMRVYANH